MNPEIRRLKNLELENCRMKKLLAEAQLESRYSRLLLLEKAEPGGHRMPWC
ncbi:hypothetical protein [Jeongeupia chitinilytica]|uniref:hypothetical protein n=1 Tax=Jeongeupia chitinilytica TaxID=1041641 RepID=UPI001677A0CD|nr:hypothetical protein [Jeongeupia chitinilytica]